MLLPASVFRVVDAWEISLSGEEFRGLGWAIREDLNILAERVNRYNSLKGDAEDELEKLRSEMEALASNNATLREENGELFRSIAADLAFKRCCGNDGLDRGRGT